VPRAPRPAVLLGLVLLLVLLVAVPAEAAKRKVPFGFFGTVVQPMPDAALDGQMALMAQSGVESGRLIVRWETLEPARGVYTWEVLDRFAAVAAAHGLSLLPNVTQTPRWASERPDDPEFWRWPGDPTAYAELMRQLVCRYGPNGSFWAQNPGLPRKPIREWQIWNEQTAPWHWKTRPWGPSYTRLLKASYKAIHGADRRAKVVAGSLVAFGSYAPWDGMRELYRAGAKKFFDVIAVHPFTNARSAKRAAAQTLEIVRRVRAQMVRRRDRRKEIILTEMTWPAAVGEVPQSALEQAAGLATTRRGQALRLTAAYRQLARARRKMRITQVYWYAWTTEYDRNSPESVMAFRYSGLNRVFGGVFSPMPILRTYSEVAAKYEGCRKSADARRCRG
jgi:polysaccharide biosynthesis protein PslG